MLIQALCSYYDQLERNSLVNKKGFSQVGISYLVSLTDQGQIADIIDYRECEEISVKDKVKLIYHPRKITLPLRTQKSGIDLNIIEHRSLYIFGLNYDKKLDAFTPNDNTNKAIKSHQIFVKGNLEFIEDLNSPMINAYRNFLNNWDPQKETENIYLKKLGKNYDQGTYFAFCLDGEHSTLLHEDSQLIEKWKKYLKSKTTDTNQRFCAISGELGTVSKIHNKIQGISGGQSSGCVLVGYNNQSEESYNKTQSYNSNISEDIMNKYTEALNFLTTGNKHKTILDEMTIVYFAIGEEDNDACNFFSQEALGANKSDTENALVSIMEKAKKTTITEERLEFINQINKDVEFYVIGIKPNATRLSLKFIYKTNFGKLFNNLLLHNDDLKIVGMKYTPTLYQIKKEMISPNSKKETIDTATAAKLIHSIINGYSYPNSLLATIVKRVKLDSNTETNQYVKINSIRAGVIKACVNRNSRINNKKEELTLSLDKSNSNQAYVCGRLFAILEKAQQDASGNNLNRTIRDSYFSSACTTPSAIFPKLLKLTQYHISKANYGYYWQREIGEISSALEGEFPSTLNLIEQGKFIVGYYHQYYYRENLKENK